MKLFSLGVLATVAAALQAGPSVDVRAGVMDATPQIEGASPSGERSAVAEARRKRRSVRVHNGKVFVKKEAFIQDCQKAMRKISAELQKDDVMDMLTQELFGKADIQVPPELRQEFVSFLSNDNAGEQHKQACEQSYQEMVLSKRRRGPEKQRAIDFEKALFAGDFLPGWDEEKKEVVAARGWSGDAFAESD